MVDDTNYTKRELDEKFDRFDERQEARHQEMNARMDVFESNTSTDLHDIKKAQAYTNGKVRWHEKLLWLVTGFCACLSVVVLPLIWSLLQSGKL